MKFEIFNKDFFEFPNLSKVLEKLFPASNKMVISIIFLSELEMKELNLRLRKKDEVTDVLSLKFSEEIGEVYIASEYIKKNSGEFEREVIRMIIHGTLHILDYEHEGYFYEDNVKEEMFKIQEKYLKEFYDILEK